MKIIATQISPVLGDIEHNAKKILATLYEVKDEKPNLVVFPEFALTGYPLEDLAKHPAFLNSVTNQINLLVKESAALDCAFTFSSPVVEEEKIYNKGIVIKAGKIAGEFYKSHLPNYGVFDEKRIFASKQARAPIFLDGCKIGFMICEDMWFANVADDLAAQGADFFIVLNASPFELGKKDMRRNMAINIAIKWKKPLLYVNQYGAQDELVFDGGSFCLSPGGKVIKKAQNWCEAKLVVEDIFAEALEIQESIASDQNEDIYQALVVGLRTYIERNGFQKAVIGLSGGIDSALVATLAADSIGPENVHCIMLPSQYTSNESLVDAKDISMRLRVKFDNLPISNVFDLVKSELNFLFQGKEEDVTEENIQSRIRALLLMAISNKFNEMLLSTTNKSEAATGYGTIYGDISGGFAPIKDIYKTQVYQLCNWRNKNIPKSSKLDKFDIIPQNIIHKAPSAELKPNQLDSDSLPDYDTLDNILYEIIENDLSPEQLNFDINLSKRVYKMLLNSEHKRRQSPPGIKINRVILGRDRRYPITNGFNRYF